MFFFALECPLSYLAAERVERALGEIEWVPVIGALGEPVPAVVDGDREQLALERLELALGHADRLRLPMVDPPVFPMNSRRASRVAVYAAEHDRVHQYSLSMSRLAFCGGFDLDDDIVIEEAAASAGLDPLEALIAANNPTYDLQLDATSRGLARRGVGCAPAIRIASSWFEGADPLLDLSAWAETRPTA